jgi:hypothetical protein
MEVNTPKQKSRKLESRFAGSRFGLIDWTYLLPFDLYRWVDWIPYMHNRQNKLRVVEGALFAATVSLLILRSAVPAFLQ